MLCVLYDIIDLICWHPLLVFSESTSSTSGNDAEEDLLTRRKKARTAFSREQVAELEKKFQDKKYLSSAERGELAEKLKLSDMQVKTWFQNRRMKYKRQSEETEMEMKSPKYSPYGSFVYRGVAPFYVPMTYKPENSLYYPYGPNIRSPQQSPSMEASFQMQLSSPPAMLGALSSHSMTRQPAYLPRTHSAPYNGMLTPISPSPCYTHSFYSDEVNPSQTYVEWQRALPTPPSPWITLSSVSVAINNYSSLNNFYYEIYSTICFYFCVINI